MNKLKYLIRSLVRLGCCVCAASCGFVQATVLVQGPGNPAPYTFTELHRVTASVFDRATGTFYVGTSLQTATVYKALRPFGDSTPILKAIVLSPDQLDGEGIAFLALATAEGNIHPKIAVVASVGPLAKKRIQLIYTKSDGTSSKATSENLKDASGAPNEDGQVITKIVALSAKADAVFAAVAPHNDDDTAQFGDPSSGIAVVCIYQDGDIVSIRQSAAVAGDSGIKALLFDETIAEIRIAAGSQPTLVRDKIDLCWDERLDRLYAGVQLKTSADEGSGGKSVVVMRPSDCGVLTRVNIAPDSALNTGTGNDKIVVTNEQSADLAAIHVRVMHCTTGPSYLIVNGGNGTQGTTNNKVYALPLVDKISDDAIHGTLARVDSALVDHKFVVPATDPAHLATSADSAALVGGGPLPIEVSTPISDIEVIDDTVYVSIAAAESALNNNGIFYSQAVFDETGKVLRWTSWAKRAFPVNAFDDAPCVCNGVSFFAVDALTGKIWAVDGALQRIVRLTAWNCCETASPWTSKVGTALSDGCYCVLDLDQGTRGFSGADAPYSRYALFGGVHKVAMLRISQASVHDLNSPQEVFDDFTDAANFLAFQLTPTTGCVMHLEYARRLDSEGDTNYFFAGTTTGLYVLAKKNPAGGGFAASELGALNNTLMGNVSWNFIDALKGEILGLRTAGKSLYVLVRVVEKNAFVYRLYNVPFDTTIAAMFAAGNLYLLAESGSGAFTNVPAFYAIEPVKTGATPATPDTKEQLVMATSAGLFRTDAVGGTQAGNNGVIDATTPTEAAWTLLPANNKTFFWGITGMDIANPDTIWPFSCEDELGLGTYEKSKIYQISAKDKDDGSAAQFNGFVPDPFNARSDTTAFKFLDPITAFWSDGARRLFALDPLSPVCPTTCTHASLMILPYDTIGWNVTAPAAGVVVGERVVASHKWYYWMHHIGATGVLMVGTERGVMALE